MGNEIGQRILAKRHEKRWTQMDLANASGCSRAAICHYESGFHAPRHNALVAIAKALGCHLHDLDPNIPPPAPGASEDLPAPLYEIVEAWPDLSVQEQMEVYDLALKISRKRRDRKGG